MTTYTCARCGRVMQFLEGRIGDRYYCHPADLPLHAVSCYTRQCWEEHR